MITYTVKIETPERVIVHEIDNVMPKITIESENRENNSLLGSDERVCTIEKEVGNDL